MRPYGGEEGDLFEINASQLRGKQSVRATFRVSDQMIDLLKVAANHLEVQQKSLIDELVQNRETLDRMASESQNPEPQLADRRQKTFVLSRNTLTLLDDISERYDLSRDVLVELCISRLIPFVDQEQHKHTQRRQLLKDADQYLEKGRAIVQRAEEMLGPDDRFRVKLEEIVGDTERHMDQLRRLVKEKKSLLY